MVVRINAKFNNIHSKTHSKHRSAFLFVFYVKTLCELFVYLCLVTCKVSYSEVFYMFVSFDRKYQDFAINSLTT